MTVFDPAAYNLQPVLRAQHPSQNVVTFYMEVDVDGRSGVLNADDILEAIRVCLFCYQLLSSLCLFHRGTWLHLKMNLMMSVSLWP